MRLLLRQLHIPTYFGDAAHLVMFVAMSEHGDSMGIEFFPVVCFILNPVNEHDTCLQRGKCARFDYKLVPRFYPHPRDVLLQPRSLGSSHDALKLPVTSNEQSTLYLGVRPQRGCRYCTQKAARS